MRLYSIVKTSFRNYNYVILTNHEENKEVGVSKINLYLQDHIYTRKLPPSFRLCPHMKNTNQPMKTKIHLSPMKKKNNKQEHNRTIPGI